MFARLPTAARSEASSSWSIGRFEPDVAAGGDETAVPALGEDMSLTRRGLGERSLHGISFLFIFSTSALMLLVAATMRSYDAPTRSRMGSWMRCTRTSGVVSFVMMLPLLKLSVTDTVFLPSTMFSSCRAVATAQVRRTHARGWCVVGEAHMALESVEAHERDLLVGTVDEDATAVLLYD